MKLCKVCKKPNTQRTSYCSYECGVELARQKDIEKRQKRLLVDENKLNRHIASVEKKLTKKQQANQLKLTKKKAWKVFSDYIRKKYADSNGMAKCVTCGKVDNWKKMHAGHAISGRGGRVLFEEKIVRCQCFYCNCIKNGRYDDFIYYLTEDEKSMTIEEYWQIKKESKLPVKLTLEDYKAVIEKYK
jgi:hypothetical protein